ARRPPVVRGRPPGATQAAGGDHGDAVAAAHPDGEAGPPSAGPARRRRGLMDLELSDDQEELRSSVRAVLERECPVSLVRSIVEGDGSADALWHHMVALDWPAL